jgi:hypothetical protein
LGAREKVLENIRELDKKLINTSTHRDVKGNDCNVDDIKDPIEAIIEDIMGNLTKK